LTNWRRRTLSKSQRGLRTVREPLILSDVKYISTDKDPKTFIAEFLVKDSSAVRPDVAPNAPGTTVSVIHKWTIHKSAKGNSRTLMDEIIKCVAPDFSKLSEDEYKAALRDLLRKGEDGYTDSAKLCPARGVEIAYETYRQKSKAGTDLTLINFKARKISKEELAANRTQLG
jgi:hypothetical protein